MPGDLSMIQHSKFQIIYRSIALLVCTHILTPCNRAENVPTTSIPSFYLMPTVKLRNVVWRGWEDSDEVVCPPRFSPPPGTARGELQSKAFPQLFPSSPQLLRPGDWLGLAGTGRAISSFTFWWEHPVVQTSAVPALLSHLSAWYFKFPVFMDL